ncbi:MAG: DUF1822 family protein [Cyanobacteriota bacterium]|nr:DUF1822 family protein [Cyanobacteriota bacterium]
MNSSSMLSELPIDFESLSLSSISLSDEQINQAIALSNPLQDEARQWATYLNALALFGFESWLEERGEDFIINRENCSIFHPEVANTIEAVANLEVNQFKVCLITVGSFSDDVITVPQAVLDLPEYAAQFYVLVEVQEELSSVIVSGFISYQTLMAAKTNANLEPDFDWTYEIPLGWFEQDPDQLLLYLRCLDSSAIALPEIPARQDLLSAQQAQLKAVLPQLQTSKPQLWNLLNWQQGISILTHSQLLRWVYDAQNSTSVSSEASSSEVTQNQTNYLSDLLNLLSTPAMNLGRWLRDELDSVASELSWVLLPQLSVATGMRSLRFTSEEFDIILQGLRNQGEDIPTEAKGGYRDIKLGETTLRLYALTWELDSEAVREWKLLLILGTTSTTPLPTEVQLRVSDATGILVEEGLNSSDGGSYIFTKVIGSLDEQFVVTLSLGSDIQETLPPFGFNPQ